MPIGIVSDVRLYREGLAEILGRHPSLVVAWAARDRDAAVARAVERTAVAVVLDLSTQDSPLLARAVRQACPALPIVAFASHDFDGEIIACAEAGIGGLVSCDGSLEDLAVAVIRAARGEMTCSPRAAAVLMQRVASLAGSPPPAMSPTDSLTLRERTILELLGRELSNKEIAARLNIQVATVKNHVHHLLEKMQVTSRAAAAAKHRGASAPRSSHSVLPSRGDTNAP